VNDIAVNNDIAYHQLIRRIQNAFEPTNFAVAVQEFGSEILVFVRVYLQSVFSSAGDREQSFEGCFSMNFPTLFIFRVPEPIICSDLQS
jgi:hypothetical protein